MRALICDVVNYRVTNFYIRKISLCKTILCLGNTVHMTDKQTTRQPHTQNGTQPPIIQE